MTATTSAAMADCRFIGFTFYPPHNDSVSANRCVDRRQSLHDALPQLALLQFTSGTIVSRPSNGTLSQLGMLRFKYARESRI